MLVIMSRAFGIFLLALAMGTGCSLTSKVIHDTKYYKTLTKAHCLA